MITSVKMSKISVQNYTTSFKGRTPKDNSKHKARTSSATPESAQAQKRYITTSNKDLQNLYPVLLKAPKAYITTSNTGTETLKADCDSLDQATLKDKKLRIYNNAGEIFGEAIRLRSELQEKIKYINELCQKCQDGEVDEFEVVFLPGDSEYTNIMMELNSEGEIIRESIIKDGILKGALEHNEDGTKSTIAIQDDGEHFLYKTDGKSLYALVDGSISSEEEFKYESDDDDRKITYYHIDPTYGNLHCDVFDKKTGVHSKTILDEGNVKYYRSYTIDENGTEHVIEHIEENLSDF